MSTSASRIANGETIPSNVTGTAKRRSAPKNDPTAAPTSTESSASRPTIQHRPGDERRQRDEYGGDPDDEPQDARLRAAVGELPAQPVAEREVDQDQADDVRPDDRGRAEVGREQTRRRDLGREGGGAGDEHDDGEPAHGHEGGLGHRSSLRTGAGTPRHSRRRARRRRTRGSPRRARPRAPAARGPRLQRGTRPGAPRRRARLRAGTR